MFSSKQMQFFEKAADVAATSEFFKHHLGCVAVLKNRIVSVKPYMRTPCGHLFHTKCLETWLEVKNECPYCRQRIPPLES